MRRKKENQKVLSAIDGFFLCAGGDTTKRGDCVTVTELDEAE
jgi:hypothetical protein